MLLRLLASLALLAVVSAQIPSYFRVDSYDLTLNFDLNGNSNDFRGIAEIRLQTTNSVPRGIKEIVLNSAYLTIDSASIILPNFRLINNTNPKTDNQKEKLTLSTVEDLESSSQYLVVISYTGKIGEEYGVFRGEKNSFIGTRLYPTYARRLFPCIDSPNMRADFRAKIVVTYTQDRADLISGLDQTKNSDSKKKLIRDLKSSMKIPPYAFFFTAGDYTNPDKKLTKIFIPNGMKAKDIGLTSQVLQIDLVQKIYKAAGISSPKLVLVPGLPADSVSSLGLTALSKNIGTEDIRSISKSVMDNMIKTLTAVFKSAFGSVVSPKSWRDVWVSESVSAYLASAAIFQLSRYENVKKTGFNEVQQSALLGSWSEKSLPVKPASDDFNIHLYLKDPAVQKGAAVLGMIESLVTDDARFSAFISIIKDRKGFAVSGDELLDLYQTYSFLNRTLPTGKSLRDMANPWLEQTGYPAVTIQRKDRDIVASQKRFAFPENKDSKILNWVIPLYYNILSKGANAVDSLKWLNSDPNAVLPIVQNVDGNTTVAVNIKGPGPYRVAYDDSNLDVFLDSLTNNIDAIPPLVRGSLISDGFAFSKSGDLKYSKFLQFLKFLRKEKELFPWLAATAGLRDLYVLLYYSDSNIKIQFENYATDLLRPYYIQETLGLGDSGIIKGMIGQQVIGGLCEYNDLLCRTDAENAYNEYIVKGREYDIVATDMLEVVYCNGVRGIKKTNEIMEYLKNNYTADAPYDVKRSVFSYLGCVQDDQTVGALVNAIVLNGQPYSDSPGDDMYLALEGVCSKPQHLNFCFKYFTSNINKLSKNFKEEHKAKFVRFLGEQGSTEDQLNIIASMTYSNSSMIDAAVTYAKNTIQSRVNFLKKNYQDILVGLLGYEPSPTPTGSTPSVIPSSGGTGTSGPTPTTSPNSTTAKPSSASVLSLPLTLLSLALLSILFSS